MKRWIFIPIILGILIIMNPKKSYANANVAANVEQYREIADRWGEAFGIPTNVLLALVAVESGGDTHAVSSVGALGLTQVMSTTLPDINQMLGTSYGPNDLFNADVSIRCGAAYLQWLIGFFSGSMELAIRAYNQGPGNIRKDNSLGQEYLDRNLSYLDFINGAYA